MLFEEGNAEYATAMQYSLYKIYSNNNNNNQYVKCIHTHTQYIHLIQIDIAMQKGVLQRSRGNH